MNIQEPQKSFTQSIIHRFPSLLSTDSDDPISAFGIEVLPGWFPIVEQMIDQINTYATQHGYGGSLHITQIKTKFCMLRCNTTIHDEEIDNIIGRYAEQASKTCEKCGLPGKIHLNRPWKLVLCDACESKR